MDREILETRRVELAEVLDNGNIRAKFVICDFDPNKNGTQINRDRILEWYQTIVNQPLVGRIKNNDFTGHNVKIVPYIDEAGDLQKDIVLDTDAFGTFVSASIEQIDGIECLTAVAEVWSRFKRAFKVTKERIESGTLYSSFEIQVNEAHFVDGIKVVDSGCFTAHCCLGKNTLPAYDSSRLIEVAECEEELAQALALDIQEIGDGSLDKEIVTETVETAEVAEVVEETEVSETVGESESADVADVADSVDTAENADSEESADIEEIASLTTCDLFGKLNNACRAKSADKWGYVAYIFPEEHTVWFKTDDLLETEYFKFNYAVNGDEVTVDEPEKVALTVSVASVNEEIQKRDNALAEANERINSLQTEVAELKPYKEAAEKAENERKAQELAQKRQALVDYALKSKFISETEIASDDIKEMLDNVDEAGIKQLIGQRFMESLNNKNENVEVASAADETVARVNVYEDDSSSKSIVDVYIHSKN